MSPSRRAGFTLMELMVVLMILGIALSFTFGNISNLLPGSRMEKAANDLATKIEELRHEAIVRGWTVNIEYDLEKHAFRAWSEPPPSKVRDLLADENGKVWFVGQYTMDGRFLWQELPDTVEIRGILNVGGQPQTMGTATFSFFPTGVAETHGIHIYSTELDMWRSVLINSIFGTPEVFDGQTTLPVLEEGDFK